MAVQGRPLFIDTMSLAATPKRPEQQVGRYAIFDEIAAGGMATVHLARLVGSGGFSRVVAAKRMHRHFLQDADFRGMFLVEARLAARILHPNVVPILDVLSDDENELIIVMEYIHGESLLALMRMAHRTNQSISVPIGCAIAVAFLEGLHAAHEAQNEKGEPLGIVHRDVSPQNVLVGADGVARVLDFGIAKAVHEQHHTNPGTIKGKFSYMAPEVVHGAPLTRQADVFSAGVVLWEVLAGKMLFGGTSEHERLMRIVGGNYPSPRQYNPRVSLALEKVVAKALQVDPHERYATALEFAIEIEKVVLIAARRVVSEWVRRLAASTLDEREAMIHAIETSSVVLQSELPASRPRMAGTPPPIPFGETHPYAQVTAEPPSVTANTASTRRGALIPERETPPFSPTSPPATQGLGHGARHEFPTDEESASYASFEVNRPLLPMSENAPTKHRRLLAHALVVTAALGVAAIVLVFSFSRQSPERSRGAAFDRAATAEAVTGPKEVIDLPLAMPEPSSTIVEPTPVSGDISPPKLSENPTKDKAVPRRSPPSSRSQSRAINHAKHYLPSDL
jgi:serine/threonine protein kinase